MTKICNFKTIKNVYIKDPHQMMCKDEEEKNGNKTCAEKFSTEFQLTGFCGKFNSEYACSYLENVETS